MFLRHSDNRESLIESLRQRVWSLLSFFFYSFFFFFFYNISNHQKDSKIWLFLCEGVF